MITNQLNLGSLPVSVKKFLESLNEFGINQKDLNDTINTNTKNLIYMMDSIDFTTSGVANIFDVPLGQSIIIDEIFIIPTEITSLTVAPVVGVGTNSTEDNIMSSTTLTGLDAITKYFKTSGSGVGTICQSGDIIKIGIDTPATATSFLGSVLIFGFYL